jgi:two-component system, NarL family, response regulator NreC
VTSKRRPYHIILADDHSLFRQDVKMMIETKAGIDVIGEANDGIELLNLLKIQNPDMVIIDISMPRMNGFEAIHEIRKQYPDLNVLVLTVHREKEYLDIAIALGVTGFVLKDAIGNELLPAIQAIQEGEVYIPLCHRNG